MPRRARLVVPGIPWHIIQRGNNKCAVFHVEGDYRRYLRNLGALARQHACAVHGYVLMTNHVHLLLTPEREDSAALLMKHLGQRYAQFINRKYQRSGTLWEGRYRSCLVQTETYLLACYRYIELNPVRAVMVQHPAEYPWSSYRANAKGDGNPLIIPHAEYLNLGRTAPARRITYAGLFDQCLDQATVNQIRHATNGNYVLGNRKFKNEMASKLGRRVAAGSPGRPQKHRGK